MSPNQDQEQEHEQRRIAVRIERLSHAADLPAPARGSRGASGYDLVAAVAAEVRIPAGERALIPTGLRLEIPLGWEGQVRPRSGLALRHGLTVANAPGTIDSDYRGEVQVILINLGSDEVVVRRGDRVAQLVFASVAEVEWSEEVAGSGAALGATARGEGGFGSTGR